MNEALVVLTPSGLDRNAVVEVARRGANVAVGPEARAALEASARLVAAHADAAEPVYGVSTGFGSLATTVIPADRREELQRSLIRSHAAGMGPAGGGRGGQGDDAAAGPVAGVGLLRGPPGRRRAHRRPAQRRDHADRSGTRVARRERRPRSARPRRPRPDRGRGVRRGGGCGRHRPDHVAGEGGSGADQRHRRHARHARPRHRRPRRAAAHSRRHGGDVDRGADGDRPGVRRRPDGSAPARRADGVGSQPPAAPRGQRDRRQPPHRRSTGAGRLLAAVHPAGARRRP